ncbi:aldose 1-epimerase family protein [Sphingomonas immobilis]|uniref:Aldose 1-epimerase family protein n=1 Tax=Sphingomonas immobilis TaxID=3063997 RepID=A0ABT8ZVQ4_9SPHN|nr:aldose 1-epimerase family protein [Sphingomonas sp. CA1-15]MDO7841649.1 aldose 1-epimerase family protein [Sphingomonas sp. CA1-15]
MTGLIEIASDHLSAAINPLGAELTRLRDAQGRELMTNADPAFWTGHAPILFPIVGRLNGDALHVDGTEYPMKQHGFARRRDFALVSQDAAGATFRLTDDAETRAAYPFAFALEIGFQISFSTLAIAVRIANPGAVPLPASLGFHPAFAWPLPYGEPREDHRIVFEKAELGALVALADGLATPDPRPSPLDGTTLPLTDAVFEQDALIWNPVQSRTVTYGASQGPQLRVDFPHTDKLGIWTKPGAAFVCIEPWHGIADPQGFTGDFREKPGVFEVAPGESWSCEMRVTLTA